MIVWQQMAPTGLSIGLIRRTTWFCKVFTENEGAAGYLFALPVVASHFACILFARNIRARCR